MVLHQPLEEIMPKRELSEEIKEINRDFMFKDQFTEPYHPQQNPVESNAIRYIKGQVIII